MNRYRVLASVRKDGAQGKFYRETVEVMAESIGSASIIAALREQHGYETEHLVCRTFLESDVGWLQRMTDKHGHGGI